MGAASFKFAVNPLSEREMLDLENFPLEHFTSVEYFIFVISV